MTVTGKIQKFQIRHELDRRRGLIAGLSCSHDGGRHRPPRRR